MSFGLQISLAAQDAGDLLKNADEYYENEQFHTAAQYYQVAVGIQPENPELNYRLAQCYRAIFDYAMAANYYQRAMDLDEVSFPLTPFYLAQMKKSMGNFKEAKDGFERFINTNKKSSVIPGKEKTAYIKQAEIEMEGSIWAIEQLGKSWREMGFRLLPEPVNSVYNDYAAVVSHDPEAITITSGRKGARGSLVDNRFGDYFTDNFRFKRQQEQWVQESVSDHFDRTNTKFSDGVGTYNATGDKYYFTSCYEGNAFCKLYVIYHNNGVWRNPIVLNENVNAPGYDNKHPTLTAGGDTLIFVSNRPGGSGGNDLWYSVLEDDENWQSPRPLPGGINTPFNEASPHCFGDNLLFFSSDGHAGIGSMDVFMAKNYTNAQSTIQNLGTPFNSGYDDSFFSLAPGRGYLSTNRPGGVGNFDIYTFNFPMESENLAEYLEETAAGTHLRSRIRESDASNLFASRDEDQFYYDNLSEQERVKLDRILSAKQSNQSDLDFSTLSKDDIRYYNKLDIGTKAIIERLALKRAMDLEGLTATSQMTPQQKLDWEYYQNIDETEKEIIDRILNVRVEGRRMALAKLNNQERAYSSDPMNKERIESKVQLRSLNSLAEALNHRHQLGYQKYQQNQKELGSLNAPTGNSDYLKSQAALYLESIDAMGSSHLLYYRSLSPEQRDNIHKSALREVIRQNPEINQAKKKELLSAFGLMNDPMGSLGNDEISEPQKAEQIQKAIQSHLNEQMNGSNLPTDGFIEREIGVQQAMLEHHLELLSQKESEARDLQQQLEHFLETQEQAPDPAMEAKIVDEFYTQLNELPLLTPKESYYFNSLSPGHLLRIERLAAIVDDQTRDQQPLTEKEFLVNQQATDQWFYLELPPDEQEMVDELIVNGWNLENSDAPAHKAFVSGLNELEKDRIDRMMGNQKLNLELQADNRVIIEGRQEEEPHVVKNSIDAIAYSGSTEIYFDFDQHTLRSEARKALLELQQYLKQSGKPVTLVIEGHTDNVGSKSYNLKLAQRRSQSAAKLFKPESELIKVSTRSFGEDQPAFDNSSVTGRQMNRRVELQVSGLSYKSTLRTYLVKPRVTLSMIAIATGLDESQIISWNGNMGKDLRAYQPIRLPVDLDYNKLESILFIPNESSPTKEEDQFHTVNYGENMFQLARMYNTTVQTLEELNRISSNDLLSGQQIRVR